MSAYTEEFLVDKLSKLVNTQESIQTLSEWVKFHKKKCRQSVEIWDRELYNAQKERKLVFLYLANDIMQTSRKKGGEFIQEYARVLPRAILHVHRDCDKDEKKAITRLLNIWRERRVLPQDFIEGIIKSLKGFGPSELPTLGVPLELDAPPPSPPSKNDPLANLMRDVAGREVEIALADEKVQGIRPQLMSGEAMVTCLNQGEVTELAIELDEAISILSSFQKSLEEDVKSRTKLLEALKIFMENQQTQKEAAEKRLQDGKKELSGTDELKEKLKQLYEKLPPGSAQNDDIPASQKRDSNFIDDNLSAEKRPKFGGPNVPNTIVPRPPALQQPLNLPNHTITTHQNYYTPSDSVNNTPNSIPYVSKPGNNVNNVSNHTPVQPHYNQNMQNMNNMNNMNAHNHNMGNQHMNNGLGNMEHMNNNTMGMNMNQNYPTNNNSGSYMGNTNSGQYNFQQYGYT